MKIVPENGSSPSCLAHQRRKTIAALSEIDRLRGHQHPYAGRNRDHDAAITRRAAPSATSRHRSRAESEPSQRRSRSRSPVICQGAPAQSVRSAYGRAASTITGANAMPLSPARVFRQPRMPAPSKQLLRRQPMPARNRAYRLAALIALGDNPRLLLRRPTAAAPGPGKHLQPANRLGSGLGLGKSSVSDICPTSSIRGRTIADYGPALERAPEDRLRHFGRHQEERADRQLQERWHRLSPERRSVAREGARLRGQGTRQGRALWRVRRWRQCRVGERRGHERHGSVWRRLHPPLARR